MGLMPHPVTVAHVSSSSRRAAVVVGLSVLVAVTGCSSGGGSTPSDAKIGHVHGIGVDPGDGALYVATHHGLYRVPETGDAIRVGDSGRDMMGFAVAGPGHFLSSGHPGPGESDPGSLGLIESTDRGETWSTVSLSGEVDFHTLHAVGGTVYGWDSGSRQLMVSTDRRTWEDRATLEVFDFAVDPSDPQQLLATTNEGLARSTDGGRSFTAGGPRVAILSWPAVDNLWAVAPDGTVLHSADEGWQFHPLGQLAAQPEAFTAVGSMVYAAAADGGIYVSTDGGKTFTVRYRFAV